MKGFFPRRHSGWNFIDRCWENLQEHAAHCYVGGANNKAIIFWRRAYLIGYFFFSRSDPRFATSVANAGWALHLRGVSVRSHRLQRKAQHLWLALPDWTETMHIAPSARSSLFHMRLEVKNSGRKEDMRRRMRAFIAEGKLALEQKLPLEATCFYARWRAEKPSTHDDLRKLLSTVLLLAQGQKIGKKPCQ